MPHYVYILQSEQDESYYKGYTTDYLKRLERHNHGYSRYTSKKRPWRLVYVESYIDKTTALKREHSLKKCNSTYVKWLIQQETNILKRE